MLPGKKAAIPRASNGGEYESPKLFTTRAFMACIFCTPRTKRSEIGRNPLEVRIMRCVFSTATHVLQGPTLLRDLPP